MSSLPLIPPMTKQTWTTFFSPCRLRLRPSLFLPLQLNDSLSHAAEPAIPRADLWRSVRGRGPNSSGTGSTEATRLLMARGKIERRRPGRRDGGRT